MTYGERVAAGVALAASLISMPAPSAGQRGGDPDSIRATRSMTAEEYQALRRQWLERSRTGLIESAPPRYGSAVVGAGDPRAGRGPVPGGPGLLPGSGIPVICSGVLVPGRGPGSDRDPTGRPGRPGDYVFRGNCGAGNPWGWGSGYGGNDPWYGPRGSGPGYSQDYAPGYGPGPGAGYGYGPGFGGSGFGGPGRAGFGFDGITEYGWTGWGWYPSTGTGFGAGPGAAYGFAPWAGAAGAECARIRLETVNGTPYEILVALRSLGVADARDLDLAIDARLSRGQPVDLLGVDGRRLRIEPGTLLDDIRVTPCTND